MAWCYLLIIADQQRHDRHFSSMRVARLSSSLFVAEEYLYVQSARGKFRTQELHRQMIFLIDESIASHEATVKVTRVPEWKLL